MSESERQALSAVFFGKGERLPATLGIEIVGVLETGGVLTAAIDVNTAVAIGGGNRREFVITRRSRP